MRIIWIGSGGFAGAVSRYAVDSWVIRRAGGAFPWGTFVVNVSGCLLLGFLVTLLTEKFDASSDLQAGLTVGFVGAYTTFSTFALQTLRLGEDGAGGLAVVYVVASVVLGVIAAWAGTLLARLL